MILHCLASWWVLSCMGHVLHGQVVEEVGHYPYHNPAMHSHCFKPAWQSLESRRLPQQWGEPSGLVVLQTRSAGIGWPRWPDHESMAMGHGQWFLHMPSCRKQWQLHSLQSLSDQSDNAEVYLKRKREHYGRTRINIASWRERGFQSTSL